MRLLTVLMMILVALAACKKDDPSITLDNLPEGDSDRGAMIFADGRGDAIACSTCHRTDDTPMTGPGLENIYKRAGERVEDKSADEYLFESILRPARHLVRGFSNQMPSDYEDKLTAQDIADLIAFLKTL